MEQQMTWGLRMTDSAINTFIVKRDKSSLLNGLIFDSAYRS